MVDPRILVTNQGEQFVSLRRFTLPKEKSTKKSRVSLLPSLTVNELAEKTEEIFAEDFFNTFENQRDYRYFKVQNNLSAVLNFHKIISTMKTRRENSAKEPSNHPTIMNFIKGTRKSKLSKKP